MKTYFSLENVFLLPLVPAQKLCIIVHRKELVKLSSSPLLLTRRKRKPSKKVKHILEDVGTLTKINVKVTVKAKALSCVPNEKCSLLTEKKTKSRKQN